MPSSRRGPVTVSPRASESDRAAHPLQEVARARRRPGWSARGQSRTVTRAAGRRGQRQERRGVGQVRLDHVVDGVGRPGSDPPPVRLGVVDLDAVLAQHRDGHVDVGLRRHRLAVVAGGRAPSSKRAPASSSAETNWLDPDASSTTRPPRTCPAPRTVNGRRVALDARRRGSRSAVSTSPTGRVRMWGSPSKATGAVGQPGDRRHEPGDRAGQPAVDRRAAGRAARRRRASRRRRCRRGSPSAASAAAISRVSRDRSARRTTEGPSASAASTRARLVSDLLPGSETVGVAPVRARAALPKGAVASGRAGHRRSVPSGPARVSSGGPWRPGPRVRACLARCRASRRTSRAARRARQATPGLPSVSTPAMQQPADHRDVLEEVDPLGRSRRRVLLPPERVTGVRRRHQRRRQHRRRQARRRPVASARPASIWTPALIRTRVTGSVGIGQARRDPLGERGDLLGHLLGLRHLAGGVLERRRRHRRRTPTRASAGR